MPKRRRRRRDGFVLVEGTTVEDEGREDAMRSLLRDYQSCGIHSYEVLSRKEFEKRHRARARADTRAESAREHERGERAAELAAQDEAYRVALAADTAMEDSSPETALPGPKSWPEMTRQDRASFLFEKVRRRLCR